VPAEEAFGHEQARGVDNAAEQAVLHDVVAEASAQIEEDAIATEYAGHGDWDHVRSVGRPAVDEEAAEEQGNVLRERQTQAARQDQEDAEVWPGERDQLFDHRIPQQALSACVSYTL